MFLNNYYAICPSYGMVFVTPSPLFINASLFEDGRFPVIAQAFPGPRGTPPYLLARSGNPVGLALSDGAATLFAHADQSGALRRYGLSRVVVFSCGETSYINAESATRALGAPAVPAAPVASGAQLAPAIASAAPGASAAVAPAPSAPQASQGPAFSVVPCLLPTVEQLAASFSQMWAANIVFRTQYFSSGLPDNWDLQNENRNVKDKTIYSVAAELFDKFHISSIREDNEYRYTEKVEASGWLDIVNIFICCATKVAALLATEERGPSGPSRPLVLISGTLEKLYAPVIISLASMMISPACRTIPGFLALLRSQFLGSGCPVASAHNFAGSSVKRGGKRGVVEDALARLAAEAKAAPVLVLLIDCTAHLLAHSRGSFGFTEAFLDQLVSDIYCGRYGDFFYDTEAERVNAGLPLLATSCVSSAAREDWYLRSFSAPQHSRSLPLSSWPSIGAFWGLGVDFS